MMERYGDQNWVYENFDPKGALHIVCPQCRSLVWICEDVPVDARAHIRDLCRSHKTASAIKAVRDETSCDLATAKSICLHVRTDPSTCHHCDSLLPRGALLCATCMSVNLDW